MYLYYNNVILITICLILSTAHTVPKKVCIEVIINNTKSISNQNKSNCLPKNLKENNTNTAHKQVGVHSDEDAGKHTPLIGFLTKETDLSILNIPYSNNENGIGILKATSSFSVDNKKQDAATESDIQHSDSPTALVITAATNLSSAENKVTEKVISAKNLFPKDTALPDFFYTNNEHAIDVLKAASSSMAGNKNTTNDDKNNRREMEVKYNIPFIAFSNTSQSLNKNLNETTNSHTTTENQLSSTEPVLKKVINISHDDKNDGKEMEVKYNEPFNAFSNTSNNLNRILNKTSNTHSKTESQLTSNEPALSELINLSLSDEETSAIGQKIEFQNSNINSLTADTNSAGAEILRNISLTCGSLFGKRISFANETTLMEFPWTALLLYNTQIRYHCGGSLITGRYVLTAAHCVAQEFYELIAVRLGEHDISEPVDCAPDVGGDTICAATIDAEVVKIIVHHEYSHLSFKNDIALLRLDKEYIARSYYPICLPTPEMMYKDSMATVAGWGATEKAIRSTVLLKADVPIYDVSKCREIYRYSVFNDSTEICGSGANEVDVCKGDSGGALFYSEYLKGKNKFYQLGIISLGVRRCGDSRFLPAVFTKVNGFYKWIENNLEY